MRIPAAFVEMAIGRLFRMGARPSQPGDLEEFEKIREVVMEYDAQQRETNPNWNPDRNRRNEA